MANQEQGLTDEELNKLDKGLTDEELDKLATAPSLGHATSISKPETFTHSLARHVIGELPAIGATIGAAGGGALGIPTAGTTSLPLAAGGAAVGSGAGEWARQQVGRWFPDLATAPKTTTEAAAKTIEQMALGGVSEAASPYIQEVFEALSPLVRRSAARGLRAVMDPTGSRAEGEALRASERILGQGGYIAPTRSALEKKAESKIATLGPEIKRLEELYKDQEIKLKPIHDALDKFEASLKMPALPTTGGGNVPVPRLTGGPQLDAIANIRAQLSSQTMINPFTGEPTISRQSLRFIRQDLDELINVSTGNRAKQTRVLAGAVEPEPALKVQAQTHMADVMRDVLNKDAPDIAKLNAEFSLWTSLKDAMSPTSLRAEFPKDPSSWTQLWHARYAMWLAAATAAGTAGYHTAGTPGAAAAVGALVAVGQLTRSTMWRTLASASKNAIADGLARGDYESVARFATRLMIQGDTKDYGDTSSGKVRMQSMNELLSPPPGFTP